MTGEQSHRLPILEKTKHYYKSTTTKTASKGKAHNSTKKSIHFVVHKLQPSQKEHIRFEILYIYKLFVKLPSFDPNFLTNLSINGK